MREHSRVLCLVVTQAMYRDKETTKKPVLELVESRKDCQGSRVQQVNEKMGDTHQSKEAW